MPTLRQSLSRRLLLVVSLFGLFVLFDLALFGWLIFRSLSQREVNRVVLETRSEAEELARQIEAEAGDSEDLYTAMSTVTDAQTYIDSVLIQKEMVQTVEVFDREGRLVFRSVRNELAGEDPEETDEWGDNANLERHEVVERTPYEEVTVPVGRVGTFVIGLNREAVEARLQVLRGELLRQAGVIGALTVLLFVSGYLLFWKLLRRSQDLEDRAKEAEQLAYVGTLASGLAHEIRSPLNSLNLNMQMLEEELDGGGLTGRRLMAITRSEISRLEQLVSDFLRYARPRPLQREPVRAVALLEHVREVLRGELLAGGVSVEVIDESGGLVLEVDRGQLNQLLLNLAQNALQAMKKPGGRLRLSARRDDGSLVLAVRDNGVGLTEEQQQRMFEVFYSTRKGGTGLGLAIAQRIASAHKGRLEVSSEPGEGTTVRLILPLASAPPTSLAS